MIETHHIYEGIDYVKTLVLYASKYGAAKNIAESIAKKMSGAQAVDLKQGAVPPLAGFDCVIIGSSVYAGAIRKEAKDFVTQNADALRGKKLGLFVSGMAAEQDYFKANFPAEILNAAKSAKFLGGVFDPAKANFFERLVMKAILKQSGRVDKMDEGRIDAFVKEMMG